MGDALIGGKLGSGLLDKVGLGSGPVDYQGEGTGYPGMPAFKSTLNPDGTLKPQNTMTPQNYMGEERQNLANIPGLNKQPLTNLETFASGTGDSPWAQAQLNALKQSQGQAMGDAKQNAVSAGTAAEDNMAARGGLSTGAMENLNRNASNNATMAGNKVVGQGLQEQGAIRSQDEQNRLGVAENLPGQEVQSLQPALQEQSLWQQAAGQNAQLAQQANMMNVQNSIGGLNAENQFNLTDYQNQIAKLAGTEEAHAQSDRGKK